MKRMSSDPHDARYPTPEHTRTHVCHCHTARATTAVLPTGTILPSNQASFCKQPPKGKLSPECISKAYEVVLINSHKIHCPPGVHPESIIHSLNTECLISSRHWGPGMNRNKQACAQVHGEASSEGLLSRHLNIDGCSISFPSEH